MSFDIRKLMLGMCICAMWLLVINPIAQADSGGPDGGGYRYRDSNAPGGPAYNWEDISGSGTDLEFGDDYNDDIAIGFNFEFYGVLYDRVGVDSNGVVYFDGIYDEFSYENECIPNAEGYDDQETFIAGFWDDLDPGEAGAVYYEMRGSAPNRRLIIQWHNVPPCCSSEYGGGSFQIILYEGCNGVLLQYRDVNFGNPGDDYGEGATVGIQGDYDTGLEYSCDEAVLESGLAILFTSGGGTCDLLGRRGKRIQRSREGRRSRTFR